MVSCRFSLKPIHWFLYFWFKLRQALFAFRLSGTAMVRIRQDCFLQALGPQRLCHLAAPKRVRANPGIFIWDVKMLSSIHWINRHPGEPAIVFFEQWSPFCSPDHTRDETTSGSTGWCGVSRNLHRVNCQLTNINQRPRSMSGIMSSGYKRCLSERDNSSATALWLDWPWAGWRLAGSYLKQFTDLSMGHPYKMHGVSSCSLFTWLSKGEKNHFQTQPLILKEWVYPRVIWCVEGPQSRKWTRLEETVHSLIQHPTSTGWWFGTFFLFFHILGIALPFD